MGTFMIVLSQIINHFRFQPSLVENVWKETLPTSLGSEIKSKLEHFVGWMSFRTAVFIDCMSALGFYNIAHIERFCSHIDSIRIDWIEIDEVVCGSAGFCALLQLSSRCASPARQLVPGHQPAMVSITLSSLPSSSLSYSGYNHHIKCYCFILMTNRTSRRSDGYRRMWDEKFIDEDFEKFT